MSASERVSVAEPPTAAALAVVGAGRLRALREAAMRLDSKAIDAAIDGLAPAAPQVAEGLRGLAARYSYDALIALCEAAEAEPTGA